MSLIKRENNNGQKAYQREDNENRSLDYRKWLRTVETKGSWCDIDLIKFKNGEPCAITELTRCDDLEFPSQNYFNAITERWYIRDGQASLIEETSSRLKVPAFLIVFGKNLNWFRIWSFQVWKWSKQLNPQEYLAWITSL